MSSVNYASAWRTKLGNHPAKDVLVKLVDEASTGGLGWPSLQLIAEHTELSLRTVRRIIQVFEAMGLVRRCKATNQYGRLVNAFQLSVEMLGADLRPEFDREYRLAQGNTGPRVAEEEVLVSLETVSQTAAEGGFSSSETVSQTGQEVSQTAKTVSQTEPPHPLNGVPVSDPLLTLPPVVPPGGGTCDPSGEPNEPDGLDAEQRAHVERCKPEDRVRWERFYREDNVAKAAERAARAKRDAALRANFPTRPAAIERVMRECSFQPGVRRNSLPEILGQVLDAELARGQPVWVTGPLLVTAWEAQRRRQGERAVKYGAVKFFRDGHWRDYVGGDGA